MELEALRTSERPTVVIDTETTGLCGDVRLVEIAVVDLWSGEVMLDTRVQPAIKREQQDGGFHIPSDATRIHHICDSDVKDSPDFAQVRGMLSRIFQKAPFAIGYNITYDLNVIRNHNQRYFGRDYPHPFRIPPAIDVMVAYARQYSEWSEYHQSHRWIKLVQAASAIGYDLTNAHGALADTLATRAIALHLLEAPE